jgi:hypothetical protein
MSEAFHRNKTLGLHNSIVASKWQDGQDELAPSASTGIDWPEQINQPKQPASLIARVPAKDLSR